MPSASDHSFSFPILIGDIGGTNARFALLVDAASEPTQLPPVKTGDFATIEDALQNGIFNKISVRPRSAILAVAGPIKSDEIPLTNAGWVIRPKDMLARLGLEDVLVINDFEAQALAIAAPADQDVVQIGGGSVRPRSSRVVLGPGTGLGVAGLVFAQDTWIPVPGEGGHVDIGPRTERDFRIWPFLDPIEGRMAGEQILCGRGIMNLYRAVCAADGVEPLFKDQAEVTTSALSGDDPAAIETVTLFATYLGRVAGDMALVFMARGGVFLAGGISQKILPALMRPDFRAAFEDKAPHSALMRTIPTFAVVHPMAALSGLAAFARAPRDFGVAMEGRRWRS
ncbi:glucokinase (glucose kinase) protein, Glk [Sinorhizobium fredii NGR234]|uniref:Glucokinase n=1 Tax=Sinorhizobium fredii (strain NBRC 101917 / NGR234) TaxID=394 RepID=GLK_SINFN|nr:glucokinase [Sinorhizobium fredii]C3MBY4.1 RecName: Full=Glucokinase; AltName: Full=Glucose kinase [Sinorhizobium fredii NGR234]ACP27209.1 glucokinase (glucose kinase) protein, Glk [Sinorhizobium fredii NGR234]